MHGCGRIACPIIAKVPVNHQALSGRDRVLFLRRFARQAVVLSAEQNNLLLSLLEKDPEGRPAPENGVFWSLSHKPQMVAGVAAFSPVGIDIELLRPVRPGLMEKITDHRERRLAGPSAENLFFRFWTAKEAVLKAAGHGLSGLSHCRIHDVVDAHTMILCCDDRKWRVRHLFHDRWVAAAACEDDRLTWRWAVLEENGFLENNPHAS